MGADTECLDQTRHLPRGINGLSSLFNNRTNPEETLGPGAAFFCLIPFQLRGRRRRHSLFYVRQLPAPRSCDHGASAAGILPALPALSGYPNSPVVPRISVRGCTNAAVLQPGRLGPF